MKSNSVKMEKTSLSKEEKRTEKALKYYKHRHLRNFFTWLWGVFSFLLILFGGIAIVLAAIPAKTLFTEEKAGKIAEMSLLQAITNINEYSFDDIPVTRDFIDSLTNKELSNGKKINQFIHIKTDDIGSEKITDFIKRLTSNPGEIIEIIASLDTVIGIDALGDFKGLSTFSQWEEVTTDLDVNSDKFVPQLYYYKSGGEYKKAFDIDKTRLAPEGETLYYGALAYVPIPDAVNLISESIGREKIVNMLSSLGGATFEEDSIIPKLLKDSTVGNVGNITLETIELNAFIPESNNEALYSILRSACVDNLGPNDPVTLQNIANGLNMEKIRLTGFLDKTTYATFYNILCDALDTNPSDGVSVKPEDITIADLGKFNITNTKLTALLGEKDENNETIYNLICSACGVSNYKNLTVNDLQGFSLNEVYLVEILPDTPENQEIYNTILSLNTEVSDKSQLKIKHLSNLDPKTMSLKSVGITGEVLSFLSKALNMPEEDIKVNNLSSLKIDEIPLSAVLKYEGNESIYNLLLSSLTSKNKDTINVGDLKSFDVNSVKLKDILGEREDNLYDILKQAAGKTDINNLTVGSLNSGFDIGKVKLTSLLTNTSNDKVFDILTSGCGVESKDKLTVNSLSSFKTQNILIDSVLHEPEEHVKWLMQDACSKDYDKITLDDLTTDKFDINNVKVCHVMNATADLQVVLSDACGVEYDNVTFGHLDSKDTFKLENVKLRSLINDSQGNEIIDKLIAEENDVRIGNVGEKLEVILPQVRLSSVLTSDTGNKLWDKLRNDNSVTVGNVGEKLSEQLSSATIGSLIEDGVINVDASTLKQEVLNMTLDEAILALNNI